MATESARKLIRKSRVRNKNLGALKKLFKLKINVRTDEWMTGWEKA